MLSVGPVGPVIITIRTITVTAWLTVVVATFPFGDFITDDVVQLALLAAGAGTLKYILRKSQKPALEVYEAGKEMGRRELMLEQAHADSVVHLEDRRQLRAAVHAERAVVGGGRWRR